MNHIKRKKIDPGLIGSHILRSVVLNAQDNIFEYKSNHISDHRGFARSEEEAVFNTLEGLVVGDIGPCSKGELDELKDTLSDTLYDSPNRIFRINFVYDAVVFLHIKERTFKRLRKNAAGLFYDTLMPLAKEKNKKLKHRRMHRLMSPDRRPHEYTHLVQTIGETLAKDYNYLFQ